MIAYRFLIYLADTIGILLMVMVIIFGRRGRDILSRADRFYNISVYMIIALCALDFPIFYFDGLATAWTKTVLYTLNTVQALMLTGMTYIWMLYVFERTGTENSLKKRRRYLYAIPFCACVVIYVINLFIPVVYHISDDFFYIPDGFLYPAVLGIDLLYFVGSSIYGIIMMRRSKNYQFFPFVLVLIFAIAGSVIQMINFRISVIYLSVAMAFTAIFMGVQNENSYIDALSHVYNRQYLTKYVARLCNDSFLTSRSPITCILLDVDGYKKINDTYGHQVGDQVIRDLGGMLLEAAPPGSVCARYGGDEFVVILQTDDQEKVQSAIEKFHRMRRRMNESGSRPYHLHVSIGTTVFDPGTDTSDAVFRRMDHAMYEEKKLRHSKYGYLWEQSDADQSEKKDTISGNRRGTP